MKPKKLWILVKVERGLPASVSFFKDLREATAEETRTRKRLNLDYDDTQMFEVELDDLLKKSTFTVQA